MSKSLQFKLRSPFQPTGDQPAAIEALVEGLEKGKQHQTLLGVTGSGKTFTMANVIERVQKPTLILAHNKTLAAQLYQEFRDFFPENAVSYFVSFYDYYQPEAYIPTTDTYIEKEATINDEIDKLRLASTTNLLTRPDSIVIASVSCIYNLGSPVEYGKSMLRIAIGEVISRETLLLQLTNLQYDRSTTDFNRGSFRVRGDSIQVWPANEDKGLRIDMFEDTIENITWIDPISGTSVVPSNMAAGQTHAAENEFIIFPAKHYMINKQSQIEGVKEIERDLALRLHDLRLQEKIIEAHRLEQKVNYDLDMIREFGFVNGIENYSRYFDGREPGQAPFTLIDYFIENAKLYGDGSFLTIVDESHISLPQVRGMHNGDQARKQNLIEYGFRLPSALDNRPLKFEEFAERTDKMVYVSATPETLELSLSGDPVEQLIRPTGLVDPNIELRPIDDQIENLVIEIIARKQLGQRTLVTTLTKKMAEALTEFLNDTKKIDDLVESWRAKQTSDHIDSERIIWNDSELPIDQMEIGPIDPKYYNHLNTSHTISEEYEYPKVAYLHSDIETLERSDILDDLRRGVYDVVVGINLLREGLDLPEVTLVAILDADKEGFLRSRTALIQTIGRAARHVEGHAILYADRLTKSMTAAIQETLRRRTIQVEYNKKHGITAETISKPIRKRVLKKKEEKKKEAEEQKKAGHVIVDLNKNEQIDIAKINPADMTPYDKRSVSAKLKRRMNQAAKDMDFELAAILRDVIKELS
ncbi:MAG: excinuclease ABC subunit UvrB [Candidatus Pacebacteria bacterium]|nr:excinuclease ABC subunit UvrB [Candidatus Paceibacterota bacterium]